MDQQLPADNFIGLLVEVVAGFSGRRGFGISYGLPRARAA